jgi:hypothetical protein
MGYSVRTPDWRYTEWEIWDGVKLAANWSAPPAARELYDHRNETAYPTDFDSDSETVNLAGDAAYAGVIAELSGLIRAQFMPKHE